MDLKLELQWFWQSALLLIQLDKVLRLDSGLGTSQVIANTGFRGQKQGYWLGYLKLANESSS